MYLVILNHRDTIEFTLNTDCDAFINKLIAQTQVHMQKITIYSHLAYVSTYEQLLEQYNTKNSVESNDIDEAKQEQDSDVNATPF